MELILQILAGLLLFFVFYTFIMVIAGSFYKVKRPVNSGKSELPTIKVILPAYKPDRIFLTVLEQLKKAISNHQIEVLILYQNADKQLVADASKFGFPYVERSFDHLPGNSYHHALKYLADHHIDVEDTDKVMILDKDNIIQTDFFERLSELPVDKYSIIQAVRKAIKTGKGLQVFDAISERYNDMMLRRGKCVFGGTLEISGSAALINASLFIDAIHRLDPKAPGFDKNFMVNLLTNDERLNTAFDDSLVVFEEKTADTQNYQSQRLRWFGEQYFNALFHFKLLLKSALLEGKWRCLDYWLTLVRPPRSIQLVASFLLVVIDLFDTELSWISLPFLLSSISLALVASPIIDRNNFKSLFVGIPKIFISNLSTSISCLKEKYLGKFIHTR